MKTGWIGISMMVAMLLVGSANASFYMSGEVVTAPGTFSWASQDLSGWLGTDAAAGTGTNANSAMFDGNADCYDSNCAPIAAADWSGVVVNPVIGVYDLGQSYQVTSIELLKGPGNGWWGNLGGTVRVSDTSSVWESATEIGTLAVGGLWSSPPGTSASASFDVNASIRYVLLMTSFTQSTLKLDEMNIYATPEPMTLSLLSVGGLGMLIRRKR